MLNGTHLTHPPLHSRLGSWQPSSRSGQNLLMAFLATVAAHQIVHLVFDLVLGWKRARSTPKSSIHIQLLCDESSPLSVAAATLRQDKLDRHRFRRTRVSPFKIVRDPERIRPIVLLQLFSLLVAAPLINFICIIPALEYNQTVTFAKAGFPKVALGFSNTSNVTSSPYWRRCYRFHSRFGPAEKIAAFVKCRNIWDERNLPSSQSSNFSLTVESRSNGELSFQLFMPRETKVRELIVTGNVYPPLKNTAYRLRTEVSREDMNHLLNYSFQAIHNRCPSPSNERREPTVSFNSNISQDIDNGILMKGTVLLGCAGYSDVAFPIITIYTFLTEIQHVVAKKLHIVEADRFEVAKIPTSITRHSKLQNMEWKSGAMLPMLIVRRNYVAPGVFIVVTVVVIVLKALASCIFNNDVYDAIEYLLAMKLGSPFRMLRDTDPLNYGLLDDLGEKERYGVEAVCESSGSSC